LLGVIEDPELCDVDIELAAGDALVLYTDGVTERHSGTRFFDEEGLASVLSRCTGFTAPVLAERIETASRAFLEDLPRDDLAVVVVRAPEPVASASAASTDLPADITAPLLGRRFVVAALGALGLNQWSETAALLASELVTNSLVHAVPPYRIAVETGEGVVRVGVSDGTSAGPQVRPHDPDQTSGRGIRLVETLADRWGVHLGDGGKSVWFELDT
jgi:anti-sigma regulatory factor (Ser/Thr protein kinase)